MDKAAVRSLNNYVKRGRFYESVVEDGSDIIFVVDYDAKFLYHNASVKETLGYSNKALVGRNFFEFIHPNELDEFKRKFGLCKKKPYFQGVEFQFLCKDGTYRFLEFNSINLKQKDGLNGLIMDCRDITQRKKDAAELLRAQKARELFLANISHEIRTPINGISGMATLLSNNPSLEDSKTYLSAIKSASDNLKVIINDILDLSSIESGKLNLERIGFNMEDLIASLINSFKAQALTKNLELHYDIEEKAKGIFMGDPVRLNQILINLIGNALKFTHRGFIKLTVSVIKKGKQKSVLQFDVIDTGIGIPKEKLNTIFESFSQADASVTRKYGGTGLGLTIVKQLVELQKGWIKLKSEEDIGSTFSVAIPYAHGEAVSDKKKLPLSSRKRTDGLDLSRFTILLVEDNDINRLYAGSILKTSGCQLEVAENGLVALGKLKSSKIDLILMDIQMPVMDGFEATKAIRSGGPPFSNLPIIALTANTTPKVIERCAAAGMNAHLGKPFTPAELFVVLEKYLNIKPKVKERRETPFLQKTFTHIDLSFLARISGGDNIFVKDVISSFLDTAPPIVEAIQIGLRESNPLSISQSIHKVKPSLTMLGLTKTKELADYLEAELTTGELTDYLKQGIFKFCDEVGHAIRELTG
jgi:PAS domain S-box-containing protein